LVVSAKKKIKMKKTILLLAFLWLNAIVFAQDYSNDVKSIDKIIKSLYEVISGEAGKERNWDRFRFLFGKDAKLIPTSKNADGHFQYRVLSPEEYITMFTTRIKTGFFEIELSQEVQQYGTIAHVFSTYSTSESPQGIATNRGINSIQLFKDKDRYYIVNIFWCAESMGFPLPNNR
jgi:hypothetical protein